MRQLAVASTVFIVCSIIYVIVEFFYKVRIDLLTGTPRPDADQREQAELELAEANSQVVLVGIMWDAVRWLFVAQLYYGLR